MNETNLDPNSNAAFTQSSGAQSNPFTGELKGEFSSDFGTNTNAVSQIFKSGGFASEGKTKIIIGAVAALLLIGGAAWFFTSTPADETAAGDEAAEEEGVAEGEEGAAEDEKTETAETPAAAPAAEATKAAEAPKADAVAAAPAATGAITLSSPANGASQTYDESQGPADFSWEGPADEIVFSRSQTMEPVTKSVKLNGASTFSFENPYPGTWYWQVKNASGASEVRSFRIAAPDRRSFPVNEPKSGGSLAGNGGLVSWQAGDKVARYSVELTPAGQSFAAPTYRFGTSGTSVSLQGVSPGQYDIRVGAFSEVAGRWEWQVVNNVSVQ